MPQGIGVLGARVVSLILRRSARVARARPVAARGAGVGPDALRPGGVQSGTVRPSAAWLAAVWLGAAGVVATAVCAAGPAAPAAPVSLQEAVGIATQRSARARIIQGDLDIAEQSYRAKRINFYLPTISINGAVPSYDVDQSFKFFGASSRKQLYKTTDLGFTSFIKLDQSLFTGGTLAMTANLASTKNRYPDTGPAAPLGSFLDERSERGYFDFVFQQPLLKPSPARNELADKDDDRQLARLTQTEELASLQKEVTEAYMDLLLARVQEDLRVAQLESARLTATIDSTKWVDAVSTREDWLASSLARLDAELAHRDAQAQTVEQQRALALLLDADPALPLAVEEPAVTEHPADAVQQQWLDRWESAVPIRKAELKFSKARRAADFAATGKGLTGDFRASYSTGRGEVRLAGQPDEPINTQGWGVALNVSYPLWDGGASGATVAAAHAQAERAEMELLRSKQEERSTILRLVNQLSVGYRRLAILRSQIELAGEGVEIAQARFTDGRISRVGLLQSQILSFEARTKYLTEVKSYLANRATLESTFTP